MNPKGGCVDSNFARGLEIGLRAALVTLERLEQAAMKRGTPLYKDLVATITQVKDLTRN
jgi:hypothetical protein